MYALAEPQLVKCTFSDRRLVRLASDEGAVRANNLFENIGKAETKIATRSERNFSADTTPGQNPIRSPPRRRPALLFPAPPT